MPEAVTVISKAKELIETVGSEKAIEFFQEIIDSIGEPKSFDDVCNISGNECAIKYIKDEMSTQ